MRAQCLEVGITHTQFLHLTLREIGWYFAAWAKQQKTLNERVMLGAWWGEVFSREKTLRSFEAYVSGERLNEEEATDEGRAAIEELALTMAKPEEQPT